MDKDNDSDNEYLKLMHEIQDKLRTSDNQDEIDENYGIKAIRNIEFELVPGSRSTSKLLWVPSEQCFYKQNTYSKTYNGMAYKCYEPECRARKVLTDQNTRLITIAATHKTHMLMYPLYKEFHYLNLMKDMCRTEPHSVAVSEIYNKVQSM